LPTKATGGIDVSQLFANLDKNKDGKLTADEVTSAKTFQALDLNKDGEVSKEEATEALKKQAERRQSKSPQQ
jgi:Ca2+-binding EF-hand superfamily protein